MKTTDFIKTSLASGKGWMLNLIFEMQDAPLTQPTPHGGNHRLWVLGHIVHSESNLLDMFILGKPNRFPELENWAAGSQATTNADDYPTMAELLVKFEQIRADSLTHLSSLSDDDLDQKSQALVEYGEFLGTVGACYSAMIAHMAVPTGPIADARRWSCSSGVLSQAMNDKDTILAERIRTILKRCKGYSERKMSGSVCFIIGGNLCCGPWKGSLIVRWDKEDHDATQAEPHTRLMNVTGKVMRGWALIEPAGGETGEHLNAWLRRAAKFAATLRAKSFNGV